MGSRMAEVAKMLGVEFDEAFKIKEAPLAIYKIVENGLLQYDRERDCWNLAPRLLTEILAGYIEIVEPAWEPKEGEECYIAAVDNEFDCYTTFWENTDTYKRCYDRGLVFKTREEAVELARRMLAVAKEGKSNG